MNIIKSLRFKSFLLKGLLGAVFFLAAGFSFAQEKSVKVFVLKGPSGVGLIQLFENPPQTTDYNVSAELVSQADIMTARIITGEVQIGILPVNTAAKIAASGGAAPGKNIQIAAITGEGMLSLLSLDKKTSKIEDLKGKEVYCSGQGAVPEYVFEEILEAKKLRPDKDVKLNFSLAYPETAQSLIAGRIKYALLPEPFATLALSGNNNIRTIGDIQSEWAKLAGNPQIKNYPITALVVNAGFARDNKALIALILDAARSSIEWVVAHPHEAGLLVEKYNFGLKAAVIEKAIPKSNYTYKSAQDARPAIEFLLKLFFAKDPASIGGRLPADSFYYK